jgi:predicted transposase
VRIVKITTKAILINMKEEHKNIIDNMMTVFCTAIRYSFKRLLEGKKIEDLEKEVARKYNLNIRQAKDAVENARQIIQSQKELVKINHDNYNSKVRAIEKQLQNNKLSIVRKDCLLQNN